jgi:predicted amidohydrolase YtcJ
MVPLGMQPSFFVGHCWHWGDVHLKNFGDRALRISPVRSALEVGLVPSFHQDCPVTPPDMLESVWCAVNRVTRDGAVLDMAEAVTPYEALQAATRGSAYIYFEENVRGVLRPGALADLIVLDADPTAVTPMAIRDIRVLRTIKEGETLFEA